MGKRHLDAAVEVAAPPTSLYTVTGIYLRTQRCQRLTITFQAAASRSPPIHVDVKWSAFQVCVLPHCEPLHTVLASSLLLNPSVPARSCDQNTPSMGSRRSTRRFGRIVHIVSLYCVALHAPFHLFTLVTTGHVP